MGTASLFDVVSRQFIAHVSLHSHVKKPSLHFVCTLSDQNSEKAHNKETLSHLPTQPSQLPAPGYSKHNHRIRDATIQTNEKPSEDHFQILSSLGRSAKVLLLYLKIIL